MGESKVFKSGIVWIDWTKCICMFFVYWHHVIQLGSNVSPINIPYGPFFVNAFFFISGYLIFGKQLSPNEIDMKPGEFLRKNLQGGGMLPNIIFKIAIPSIVFSTIFYLPKVLIGAVPLSLHTYFFNSILRGTEWFTCALTVAELIIFFLLLTRWKNIFYYLIAGTAVAIVGKYLQDTNFMILGNEHLPWFFKSGMVACFFIVFGGLFSQYERVVDLLMGEGKWYVVPLIIYVLVALLTPFGAAQANTQGSVTIVGLAVSLFAIFALVYACKLLKPVRIVKFISRHSIGFFFLSASIPLVCTKVVEHFLPLGSLSFFLSVALSFLSAIVAVFLLNRYLPLLFDIRKIITINK